MTIYHIRLSDGNYVTCPFSIVQPPNVPYGFSESSLLLFFKMRGNLNPEALFARQGKWLDGAVVEIFEKKEEKTLPEIIMELNKLLVDNPQKTSENA